MQADLEKDTIKHLFDIYIAINKDTNSEPSIKTATAQWLKHMEDRDKDTLKNWCIWREMSMKKYNKEYEPLNIKFDVYTRESKVGKE